MRIPMSRLLIALVVSLGFFHEAFGAPVCFKTLLHTPPFEEVVCFSAKPSTIGEVLEVTSSNIDGLPESFTATVTDVQVTETKVWRQNCKNLSYSFHTYVLEAEGVEYSRSFTRSSPCRDNGFTIVVKPATK